MQSSNANAAALLRIGIGTPTWILIPVALLISELLPMPIGYAFAHFSPAQALGGPNLKQHGIGFALMVACLVAPLIETTLFQWGCISLLRKPLRVAPWTAIVLSAALFAASHLYSWRYALIIFPVGLVLGYVFVVEQTRQTRRGKAFWVVALLHALRNAISVALIFFAA